MKLGTMIATVGVLIGAGSVAHAVTWPPAGADTGPGIIITATGSGSLSSVTTGQPPYVTEDVYIGFVNNSSKTIYSINLSDPSFPIGYFDGDGIDPYTGASNAIDTTGYGGPDSYFTNDTTYAVTVNFIGGIAPGQSTYFSLEDPVTVSTLALPEPATWGLMLLGFGALGAALRRRHAVSAA